MAAYNLRSY